MSRKSAKRKRERQRRRYRQRPAPSISQITGETQIPTTSDVKRISTATLIAELQQRPDSRGLIAAFAELYK
jgi:hypothetical protein